MIWPFTPNGSNRNSSQPPPFYSTPEFLLTCFSVSTIALSSAHIYRNYMRRIPTAAHIPHKFLRTRGLLGRVTSVGDGDNFRIFHTPGGRLMGWGWCRKVPTLRGKLRGQTIHIRLAGIDAPECGHFGNAAQPYSSEALAWLQSYVGGRRVRCYIHSKDQYDRVVATVYVWRGLWRRDVSLEMLKAGMAVVYEGKMNVEFGGKKKEMVYRETEKKAMAAKMGLWKQPKRLRVSPGQYKAALKEAARAAS